LNKIIHYSCFQTKADRPTQYKNKNIHPHTEKHKKNIQAHKIQTNAFIMGYAMYDGRNVQLFKGKKIKLFQK
jgi:hypothetical protein